MKYSKILLSAAASLMLFTACNDDSGKIEGTITGADGKVIALQRPDMSGNWLPLDSVTIDKNGNFSISYTRPDTEEVYRLVMDGRYIYFPVEADEKGTLRVNASAADFGIKYSIEGSETAKKMAAFDIEANRLPLISEFDSITRFKRKVFNEIIHNSQGSLLSYYVLTKAINGKLLFDPENPENAGYISAVATAFKQFKPDDSHTEVLEQLATVAQRNRNKERGVQTTLQAEEIEFIDIALPDANGKEQKLSSYVGKGTPTLLVFNILTDKNAINITKGIAAARERHGGNLNVYQIGYDSNVHAWSEAAGAQPWVNVYDTGGYNSENLIRYNVGAVPVFFIFNAGGQLIDRASSLDELREKI